MSVIPTPPILTLVAPASRRCSHTPQARGLCHQKERMGGGGTCWFWSRTGLGEERGETAGASAAALLRAAARGEGNRAALAGCANGASGTAGCGTSARACAAETTRHRRGRCSVEARSGWFLAWVSDAFECILNAERIGPEGTPLGWGLRPLGPALQFLVSSL